MLGNKVRSVLQLLYRAVYGPPRQRPIKAPPKDGGRPEAPWATKSDGTYGRQKPTLDSPPLQILRRSQDMQRIYAEMTRVSGERENRYKDYEDMILDSTIAGAIELMVDDACQYSRDRGATVWLKTEDDKIRKEGEKLFDQIQLEERLFDWAFNTALYGDFFLQVVGEADRGVYLIMDDWHPADVQRLDVNGALIGFRTPRTFVETVQPAALPNESDFFDPWDFVHFRIQASQRRRREVERQRMAPMIRFEKDRYRLTTRYGVSVVESVRRTYKQLQMVEQSLIIARMTRAIMKYIYKIQVGKASKPKQAAKLTLEMKDLLTQQSGIKLGESFDQQWNPPAGSEDIFLPVWGDRGDVTIEKLGGEVDIKSIVDVDYLRNKLFGGIKVPKAYLGFEESLPGSLGESALLRLDIRYARTVKRVQRALIQGFTRLLQIHLAYRKINPDPRRFSIEMDVISTAEEEERKSALSTAVGISRDLAGLNHELRLEMPPKEFARLVYSEFLGLSGRFLELVDKAEILPAEVPEVAPGEVPPMPPGMPPGEEMPPEGALEVPPPPEEEEEGPLEAPAPAPAPGAAPESARRRPIGRELREKKAKQPKKAVGEATSISAVAKREAMAGMTSAVRHDPDLRAEKPTYTQSGEKRRSKLSHWRSVPKMKALIDNAIRFEQTERDAERKRTEDARKKLEEHVNAIEHVVAGASEN